MIDHPVIKALVPSLILGGILAVLGVILVPSYIISYRENQVYQVAKACNPVTFAPWQKQPTCTFTLPAKILGLYKQRCGKSYCSFASLAIYPTNSKMFRPHIAEAQIPERAFWNNLYDHQEVIVEWWNDRVTKISFDNSSQETSKNPAWSEHNTRVGFIIIGGCAVGLMIFIFLVGLFKKR